jgi:hypothetical protein
MRKSLPYTIWLVVNALWATGFGWLVYSGAVSKVFEVDTHWVITTMFGWFVVACLVTGYTALRMSEVPFTVTKRRLSFTWFSGQQLLNLGLFGTTLGFIGMLTVAFVGKDFSDTTVFRSVLPLIGGNWAAALYATATAIASAIILMLQAYFINYLIEVAEEEMNDADMAEMLEKFGIGEPRVTSVNPRFWKTDNDESL